MMNKQKYYISVVYHNVMRGLAIYCGLILGIIVILKLTGDRYGIVSILVLLEYVGIAFLLVYGIGFFIDGYYIQDEKIVYYHNFKRRKKDLSEVKSVIISNTYLYRRNLRVNIYKNGKFVHCPWITLFFEEIDAGLLVKDRKELNTLKVEHQLYKNCSKYGFIYKNNMDKFLMNFTGEVYIAKTIYLNFEEEMKKLFGAKVIYIISDMGGEN